MEPVKSNLRLTSVIAAIPLGMAALFLAGNVSSGAFLRDLGLSAAQFPSQFEWTILGGFTTLFVYGFTPVLFFIVAIAVCTTAMVIAIQIIRWRRAKGARKARSERKASGLPERGNTVLDEVESFSDLARDAAVVGIAFIVAISPLILVSGKAGDSAADDFKKRAAAGASVVSEIYFKSARLP